MLLVSPEYTSVGLCVCGCVGARVRACVLFKLKNFNFKKQSAIKVIVDRP